MILSFDFAAIGLQRVVVIAHSKFKEGQRTGRGGKCSWLDAQVQTLFWATGSALLFSVLWIDVLGLEGIWSASTATLLRQFALFCEILATSPLTYFFHQPRFRKFDPDRAAVVHDDANVAGFIHPAVVLHWL